MQTSQLQTTNEDAKTTGNETNRAETEQGPARVYLFVQAVPEEQLLQDLAENETHEQREQEGIVISQEEALSSIETPPRRKYPSHISVSLVILCLIATALGYVTYLLLLPPTVTVTIIPRSVQAETTGTITIATSKEATNDEIPGRMLPAITMSQSQTAATTGITAQAAQPGRGTITFYNSALYPQTIVAGTLLTGADGRQVVTDYAVTVPSGTLATNGQASVSAHSLILGTTGNIKADDVYGPCCLLNIQAESSPFTGGQEAETYQSVTKADIDTTAASLKTSITQTVTAALQIQVHSNETLATPPTCQQTVTANHEVGEKAIQVQVTISASCTAVTYETQSFQQWLTQDQAQTASKELREHYRLTEDIPATIQTITEGSTEGAYQLTVQSKGTWVYHFSQTELSRLATTIAGKGKDQATTLLLHTPGVQMVSLRLDAGQTSIPTDPSHIHFLLLIG